MPSRIRIGPDGGPYVIVEENNGDLDITTPDNTIDLQNSGLINAALSGVLDAQNNDISNVGALTADSVSTGDLDTGRSWADLESSRSFDTLYTNDTDSEIWVWVVVNIQADGTKVQLNMGNSSFAPGNDFRLTKTLDSGDFETFGPFVVPPDEEYEVANFSTSSGDVVIDRWSEFR